MMITEIVTFGINPKMSREEVLALFEHSAEGWRENSDLLHKNYLYDAERNKGGGVYLWKSMDAARQAHGAAFQERIKSTFDSVPSFEYFETPVVVNNYEKSAD